MHVESELFFVLKHTTRRHIQHPKLRVAMYTSKDYSLETSKCNFIKCNKKIYFMLITESHRGSTNIK